MGSAISIGHTRKGQTAVGILGKHTLIFDFRSGSEESIFQGGNRGNHLVSGAGGIGTLQRTVDQRIILCFQQLIILFKIIGRVIGGIVGADQNLTGLYIDHDSATALCVLAVLAFRQSAQIIDDRSQLGFCHHLQGGVNGNFHVGTGFGLCQITGGNQRAVGGNGILTPAVGTVEIFLISLLQATLANHGVHFITGDVLIVFPLLGIHGTHVAKNMGCVSGVVFANGGGFNRQTGDVQLYDGRESFVIRVFHEHIGRHAGNAVTQTHLIAQADDLSGFIFGKLFWNVIDLPEFFNQQRSGDIRVQIALVIQKCLEIALPGGAVLLQSIHKGFLSRNGEMVCIGNALLLTGFNQLHNVLIGAIGRQKHIMVQHQIITGTVTHQFITVTIQNITTGGFYAGDGSKGGGIIDDTACFNNLQVIHSVHEKTNHQCKEQQKNCCAQTAYSFHDSPPMVLIAFAKG